jgi:hypothetical protein
MYCYVEGFAPAEQRKLSHFHFEAMTRRREIIIIIISFRSKCAVCSPLPSTFCVPNGEGKEMSESVLKSSG